MGNHKKTNKTRESFTEDGINLWRNPRSPKGSFLAQYRLSNGVKKSIGCGTNERGKAYGFAMKKREQQEQEIAGTNSNKLVSVDNLCGLFLADKKNSGLKPDTLKMLSAMTNRIRGYRFSYCKKQKVFVKTFLEKDGREVPKLIDGQAHSHQLTQEMFDQYVGDMHIKVLADGTLRTLIGRLKTMYEWANNNNYATPKVNFEKWNKKVHYSPMRARKLDEDELDKLLTWLKNDSKRGKHNYYRLLCCSELGLRIAETSSIMVKDVNTQATSLRVARLKKKTLILDELRITDHLASELREYISSLPADQKYLFQGRTGKPMKASSEWFRHACHACNIDETRGKLVLHSARSKFITDQIEEGRSLPKIMGSVGHKHVTTTMRYLQISSKQSQVEAVELSNKRRVAKDAKTLELEAEIERLRKDAERYKKETNIFIDGMNAC